MRRTILVPTDGSPAAERALGLAVELARASGDGLQVVTVWRELRGDFGIPLHRLVPELVDVERDWAEETLAQAVSTATAAGVAASGSSRHGIPVEEICAAARELAPRLIVMGTNGWGGVDAVLFGSVARGVVRDAPCPVLVVPAPPGAPRPEPLLRQAVRARLGS